VLYKITKSIQENDGEDVESELYDLKTLIIRQVCHAIVRNARWHTECRKHVSNKHVLNKHLSHDVRNACWHTLMYN